MNQSILDESTLGAFLEKQGGKKFRLQQIMQAVFRDRVNAVDEITTIPEALRNALKKEFFLSSLEEVRRETSQKDQTVKLLFKTRDGLFLESVLMRHLKGRLTVCVSCQVGCAMACTFCATGKLGLFRNLEWFEIVDQLMHINRLLKTEGKEVTNVVFMGMGEPMANYGNVVKAIRVMNDPKKGAKGARHITVSTSGLIPGIEKLADEKLQIKLAISLHAPTDTLRSEIMPINKAYPLNKLMAALDRFTARTNKRIFYEYVMLSGLNDSPERAHELGKLLKGRLAHVNLIPWNAVPGSPYERSDLGVMRKFQGILKEYGLTSTIRASLGDDIAAACGQLAKKNVKTEKIA